MNQCDHAGNIIVLAAFPDAVVGTFVLALVGRRHILAVDFGFCCFNYAFGELREMGLLDHLQDFVVKKIIEHTVCRCD